MKHLPGSTSSASAASRPWWRTAGVWVGAAAVGAAPLLVLKDFFVPYIAWLFAAALLGSAALTHTRRLSAQLLARSVWWQALLYSAVVLGGMLYFTDGHLEATWSNGGWGLMMMLGGAAVALVAGGKAGLDEQSPLFAPKGFRALLMLSMVLALADTQALLFYGALASEVSLHTEDLSVLWEALPFFGCAAVMGVALLGLYRLKLWGLGLNIAANLAIAGLALSGVLELPGLLAGALAATAIIQVLIPAPLLRQMWRASKR